MVLLFENNQICIATGVQNTLSWHDKKNVKNKKYKFFGNFNIKKKKNTNLTILTTK